MIWSGYCQKSFTIAYSSSSPPVTTLRVCSPRELTQISVKRNCFTRIDLILIYHGTSTHVDHSHLNLAESGGSRADTTSLKMHSASTLCSLNQSSRFTLGGRLSPFHSPKASTALSCRTNGNMILPMTLMFNFASSPASSFTTLTRINYSTYGLLAKSWIKGRLICVKIVFKIVYKLSRNALCAEDGIGIFLYRSLGSCLSLFSQKKRSERSVPSTRTYVCLLAA